MNQGQQTSRYDAVVVGGGFSGLACTLRLLLMGKRVALLERHRVLGGLNSYYYRKVGQQKVLFDSGLHALTNFAGPKDRHLPLGKILRQLRLRYDELELMPQRESWLTLPWGRIRFNNESSMFWEELEAKFSHHRGELKNFREFLSTYDEFSLESQSEDFVDARVRLQSFFTSMDLIDTLLIAPLCYGSSWQHTMDWNLFVCLFRSIFLEGLSRPRRGIQGLLHPLESKIRELGGEIRQGVAVEEYLTSSGAVRGVRTSQGERLEAEEVYTSAGLGQLQQTTSFMESSEKNPSYLSFVEVGLVFSTQDLQEAFPWALNFELVPQAGRRLEQIYAVPNPGVPYSQELLIWSCSANYGVGSIEQKSGGVSFLKLSLLAHAPSWMEVSDEKYKSQKEKLVEDVKALVEARWPSLSNKLLGLDAFTPRTIHKYTGHPQGAVYGSSQKCKSGELGPKNLWLIGADQGPPGIIGSMLSGITMANKSLMVGRENP